MTCMATVKMEVVKWAVDERIPFGNVTIVAGDPGVGKSTMVLDIAADLSVGEKLPFISTGRDPMSVLLFTAEDGLANTVKPRLKAAGADMKRVHVVEGVRDDAASFR